jgi:hypothetical protein
MTLTKRACFLAVLLVLLYARSGRADDLFNNLANIPCTTTTCSSDPVGSLFGPLADSFSTGGSSFELDSVTVTLSNQLLDTAVQGAVGESPCSGASCGTTDVFLVSDSSTSPGAQIEMLGSLNNSSLSLTPGLFTFNSFAPVDLQPNTRYWIELTSTDDNSWWQFDGGVNGEFFSNSLGVSPDSAQAYQLEVAGGTSSAVPEPSAVSLLFAGLAVLGFCAAIRRRPQACASPL